MKSSVLRTLRPYSDTAGLALMEMAIVMAIVGVVAAAVWGASTMVTYRNKINRASDELNLIASNMFAYYSSQNVSYSALNAVQTLHIVPLAIPPGATTDFCYYTPTMQGVNASGHSNIFPNEMLTAAGLANHPWSQAMTTCSSGNLIGTAQVSLACTTSGGICAAAIPNPVLFAIRYTVVETAPVSVASNVCAQFLVGNSKPGLDTRLKDVVVTWSGGSQTQTIFTDTGTTSPCAAGGTTCVMPISMSDANVACNAGTAGQTLTIDWYYQLGG
jgi:Tfp pilus assembly protein PilE